MFQWVGFISHLLSCETESKGPSAKSFPRQIKVKHLKFPIHGYLVIATSLITTADVSLEVNRFLICKKLFRTTLIRDRRRTVDSPELEPILPQRKSLDFSCDFYRNFNSPSIIRTLFVNNRRSKS